jgi:hypothetical protein
MVGHLYVPMQNPSQLSTMKYAARSSVAPPDPPKQTPRFSETLDLPSARWRSPLPMSAGLHRGVVVAIDLPEHSLQLVRCVAILKGRQERIVSSPHPVM